VTGEAIFEVSVLGQYESVQRVDARGLFGSNQRFPRDDLQARVTFIDEITTPVANKMFECGLVP
jgi:hypothetical protein